MGNGDGENMGLNFPSSVINTDSVSVWHPIVSLSQNDNSGDSLAIAHCGFQNSDYLVGIGNLGPVFYRNDPDIVVTVSKLPCSGNGSFLEMVGSFGLAECGRINNTMGCPQNYKGEEVVLEEGRKGKSSTGTRKKRGSESNSPQSHGKGEQRMEMSNDSPEHPIEHFEKRLKIEHNDMGVNLHGKQTGKQATASSNNDDMAKDNLIHMRARRGQATNSHSLAERVRRERISERMRFLQELVPGCNKITGKAVRLDAIINYVQSLQRQVEFLSMKLATVNPQLDIDIDRILHKEIIQSSGGGVGIPGIGPGITSSNPYPPVVPQGQLPARSNTPPFLLMPQVKNWIPELDNTF